MARGANKTFEFGEFQLDAGEQVLRQNGEPVPLTPKVFDLLVLLIENPGHLMDKGILLETLWKDSFVEEANLNVNISALRRALGENPNEHRYIETVPRRGYRFVADVRETYRGDASAEAGIDSDLDLKGGRLPASKRKSYAVPILIAILLFISIGALVVWRMYANAQPDVSGIRTLAVLPFKPLSAGQGDAALEIGMADALITKLGRLQRISVRPTGAVAKYTESNTDAIAAGRELQVDTVLDGKIQRSENKIRITVQLLRVSDGTIIWAESFDDFFTNIFAVQDSISERILSSISLKISGEEKSLIAKRQTENTEAYMLYLQARFYHEKISEEGSKNALVYYRAALQKDPDYALVYASMTGALIHLANLNIERDSNLQAARDSASKAVELDPNLAEAYEAAATIKEALDWDFAGAEAEYKRALALDPRSSDAHYSYSILLSMLKRFDEAISHIETARSINPTAGFIQSQVAQTYVRAHRYGEALREARKAIEMDPDNNSARFQVVRIYLYLGLPADAQRELVGWDGFSERARKALTADIDLLTDKRPEGERAIREILAGSGKNLSDIVAATYYVKLKDYDAAFETLNKAYQQRETLLLSVNTDPEWDPIRSDPRYLDLIKRMGLPA